MLALRLVLRINRCTAFNQLQGIGKLITFESHPQSIAARAIASLPSMKYDEVDM